MWLRFAALLIAERSTRAGATIVAGVLLALACWVNIGIVIMLAIATVCQSSRRVRLLAMEAARAAFSSMLGRKGADANTVTAAIPPAPRLAAWTWLLQTSAGLIARPAWA